MQSNNRRDLLSNRGKWKTLSFLPVLTLLIVFIGINGGITSNFFTLNYIVNIFVNNTPLILVSIGVAVVIIGGGIDISQGALVTLLNVLLVTFVVDLKLSVGVAGVLIVLLGIVIGMVNGVVTSVAKVPPLLSTFAMTSVLSGIAYWVMPIPKSGMPRDFVSLYHSSALSIPTPVLLLVAVVILWIVIRKTRIGIWLYSFGNNDASAYVSGVPVRFIQVFTYAFAGFIGAVAAIALTALTGSGDALIAQSMSMRVVAACVIGGLSLNGGRGGIGGAIMGAIFLCLVTIMVYSTKTQPFYQDLIEGVIILIGMIGVVVVNHITSKAKKSEAGGGSNG